MNETIVNFLKSLNIDIEKFNSLDGAKIKMDSDINPILSRFVIFNPKTENRSWPFRDRWV